MIVSGNQPYFLPYIGYWQLINSSDIFVLGDNYQYITRGWVNRNRILSGGEPHFFNVLIQHASGNKNIDDLYILDDQQLQQKRRILSACYRNAPFFAEGMDVFERIFQSRETNLACFLENSIRVVCEYLDIRTTILRSSDFPGNERLKKEQRIFDL